MNTPNQDKATSRPWVIGDSNEVFPDGNGDEAFSDWLNIIGANGKVVCELPGHSQYARGNENSKIEDANAALIVQAVNEHAALVAVAEAAKALLEKFNFKPNFENTTDGNGATNYKIVAVNDAFEALANLAAIRNQK